MNELKIRGELKHFSAESFPCGELPLASLPEDVAAAVDRMRRSLESVDPGDRHAARKLIEDSNLAVDAPMDAPVWSIAIDCQGGTSVSFQVTENCGLPDTKTLVNYLEATLPKLSRGS